MEPTSRQLLESIRWALDERVAPALEDRWAASTLRSVGTLLDHLAVRVECEQQIAAGSCDDLREVLGEVCTLLGPRPDGVWSGLRGELETVLAGAVETGETTLEALNEEGRRLQDLCDRLLRALRTDPDRLPEEVQGEIHAQLKGYLARQLERERPLFMPAFMGKLF